MGLLFPHWLLFSPYSLSSSHTGSLLFLKCVRQVLVSEIFDWLLCLKHSFPIICIAHSLINLEFLLKWQLILSLATQCKLQISPTPPQFSFLFYVSFLVSLITISHPICFTYPIFCLFPLECKGRDFVEFTALSSACRSTVPGSCYILS